MIAKSLSQKTAKFYGNGVSFASLLQTMKIMRTLFILMMAISLGAVGQIKEVKTRSIEVKGSSEMEITPNEIFVSITLKEYKQGGKVVTLDELESGLIKALKKLKINEDNLRVQNVYGHNWDWKKKKADDFLGSKNFILEVSDLKKMNDLVALLDPEGLNNMNVQSYSHSDIEGFRKQVKIGAMKAAKEKATYLLESVDEEVGRILEVQEIEYGYQQPMMMRSNVAYESADASGYQSDVDFKKIKVRAEMRVVFEIKE